MKKKELEDQIKVLQVQKDIVKEIACLDPYLWETSNKGNPIQICFFCKHRQEIRFDIPSSFIHENDCLWLNLDY